MLFHNINGYQNKKQNRHKLKAINKQLDDIEIATYIETGCNGDNRPILTHDDFVNSQINDQIQNNNSKY